MITVLATVQCGSDIATLRWSLLRQTDQRWLCWYGGPCAALHATAHAFATRVPPWRLRGVAYPTGAAPHVQLTPLVRDVTTPLTLWLPHGVCALSHDVVAWALDARESAPLRALTVDTDERRIVATNDLTAAELCHAAACVETALLRSAWAASAELTWERLRSRSSLTTGTCDIGVRTCDT